VTKNSSSSGADTPEAGSPQDFEDFFEYAPSALILAKADGRILRVNGAFAEWVGRPSSEIAGTRFSDYLPITRKVYFETHLAPLLRMQGSFAEISLEIEGGHGERIPVIVNAVEKRDQQGNPLLIRMAVLKAADRRQFERNLLEARSAAVSDRDRLRALNATLGEQVASETKMRLDVVISRSKRHVCDAIAAVADHRNETTA